MVKTEIYANRSVEEDILDEIEKGIPDINYSLIENVQGRGRNGTRRGTAIWPELSVLYVIFGDREQASVIAEAVRRVKNIFPNEGIKIFQFEMSAPLSEQE